MVEFGIGLTCGSIIMALIWWRTGGKTTIYVQNQEEGSSKVVYQEDYSKYKPDPKKAAIYGSESFKREKQQELFKGPPNSGAVR